MRLFNFKRWQFSKKWKSFLLELLLIILGINIGLWLNNWNEQRKEDQLEIKILKELQNALKKDLEDVKDNANAHYKSLISCRDFINHLREAQEINVDSIKHYSQFSTSWTFLVADISTYEYLKSIGWHIIKNDSLRNKISDLYHLEYKVVYEIEKEHQQRKEAVLKYYNNYFDADGIDYFLTNVERLKEDNGLRYNLKMMQFSHHSLMGQYTVGVQPAIEGLLDMIKEELENRE